MANNSFVKKLVIEQGEYDRLQQRQLRDYSPELHSLAALKSHMDSILARKNISAEDKLNLLSNYNARFEFLRDETGILSSGASAEAPDKAATKLEPEKEPSKLNPNKVEVKAEGGNQEEGTGPEHILRRIGVESMYQKKAKHLLLKLMDNSDVIKRNAEGELVVNGEAQPGTNFDKLFKSMVSMRPDMRQPGLDKFLGGLRQIGVKPNEVSSDRLQKIIRKPQLHGTDEHQLAVARGRIEDEKAEKMSTPVEEEVDETSKSRKSNRKTKPSKRLREQQGEGFKQAHHPPGLRPKILYVY